ncbi:MFS general substrate transporter [Patellaria atrata CBS 101060]|uniref:MFS general substrate transporter n=1 Tax=Patellaria atrata CBS 101060 TaxID=1346257 RepID=A0A9P4VMH4_9PEZI|nr:MFS general substrate transporter [Patellaria atrata CBS 101060]
MQEPKHEMVTSIGEESCKDYSHDEKQLEETSTGTSSVTAQCVEQYLKGWSLHLVSLSACLCLFLVNVEVSVVGTSLITIVRELHGVDQMGWVITGYLITYTGMIIIWAKLSDIFGRKYTAIATLFLFTAFSGACGAAQSMNELIIGRVFQGIGAAGCWSLALTIGYEMVPRERYPIFGAHVPAGAATMLLLFLTLPSNFPHQGDPGYNAPTWQERLSRRSLARLDVAGAFLLLGGTMFLVAVLLEGGISIAWNSAVAIILFVLSGVMWALFLGNEWFFTKYKRTLEPIFPWRFVHNRAWMGTLIFSFLSGIPYNVLIINIPQRFQDVGGESPMTSAVRLIPFNLLISFTCVIVNVVVGRTGIACIWFLLSGSIAQLVGLSWFCALPTDGTIPSTIYACQIFTGLGIGCVLGITMLMPPLVVEKRDLAISSGALLQFRALGGVLGLSVTTTAFNSYLKSHLSHIFGNISTSEMLTSVQASRQFPRKEQLDIIKTTSEAYNLQMKILIAFAAAQTIVVAMIYRRGHQIRVVETISVSPAAITTARKSSDSVSERPAYQHMGLYRSCLSFNQNEKGQGKRMTEKMDGSSKISIDTLSIEQLANLGESSQSV